SPVVGAQAFGAGLWFPGAGFLALGSWWMLLGPVSAILFAIALVVWFKVGATYLPPLVWLLAAGVAASVANDPLPQYGVAVASGAPLAAAMLGFVGLGRRARKVRRHRAERLEYLPAQLAVVHAGRAAVTVPALRDRELSAEDLSWLRYTLDRALADVGDFSLFDNQHKASSVRSQLASTGWALGVYQRHWTPNFHGYVKAGQRRVIEQYLHKPVWSSWRSENAWGNLSLNPDPVRRDNVKLVGHMMVNLALYELNTGDDRFSKPSGLTFQQDHRTSYRHSTHTVAESLSGNFERHQTCLYPCSPNWVYTYCNIVGLAGLTGYDTLFGTDHAARIRDHFRRNLVTEFLTPDGGLVALRSQHTGLAPPYSVPDEVMASVLNPIFPDLAEQYWAFVRREGMTANGSGVTLRPPAGPVDYGNNRPGHGSYLCGLAHAAHEMGDEEVFEAALDAMDEHCRPTTRDGARFYEGASNLVNVGVPLIRMLRKDFWRRCFVERPDPTALTGPTLVGTAYPDVLVARAVSDGKQLDLVVYPGGSSQRVALGVERLSPHGEYRVDGAVEPSVLADTQGKATLQVDLHGRRQVRVAPVA
ncbi:MAG: hypothetical protein QOE61_1468, partial [Micromonosporaceae bacterium]|nr:hypothetical protein [Micromonosporaceae bacterium]